MVKSAICKIQYKGGLQLSEIGTNNVREDEFNPRLGYNIIILYK